MNNAGIIAQYGFLFQKEAFILFLLQSLNRQLVYFFEGKDDIEITSDDKIYFINDTANNYIQVKSGNVDEECFNKIICNWLLLDKTSDCRFIIFLENELCFSYNYDDRINVILKYINDGQNKRKTSIAKQVYDKYKEDIVSNDSNSLKNDIKLIFGAMTLSQMSLDKLTLEIDNVYFNDYCKDIHKFEMAKRKRLEKFKQSVYKNIDDAIKNRIVCQIAFSDIIKIINNISENINDTRYTIDISEFKKGREPEARKIVSEHSLREVLQLKLVNNKEQFIIDGIVKELLYKDFRNVYIDIKSLEISNIETIAKDNYDSLLYELEDDIIHMPKGVYNRTIAKTIDSELLPKGSLYSTGCYIYLTSADADTDKVISWGISDESE